MKAQSPKSKVQSPTLWFHDPKTKDRQTAALIAIHADGTVDLGLSDGALILGASQHSLRAPPDGPSVQEQLRDSRAWRSIDPHAIESRMVGTHVKGGYLG